MPTTVKTQSHILDRLTVARTYVELHFAKTPQVSSISKERFLLAEYIEFHGYDDANNVTESISDPWKPIILADHYNSLTRTLVLFFKDWESLEEGDYELTIEGLKDASGKTMPTESFHFGYDFDTPDTEDPIPKTEPVHIKDFSIKNAFSSDTIFVVNPTFYIVSTNPETHEIFVEEDHNDGRMIVNFSSKPSDDFLNIEYIRVQRKKIEPIVSRWEKIEVDLSLDENDPSYLYIDFPSVPDDEEAPVYHEVGHTYFESGYKYRVRLLSPIEADSEYITNGNGDMSLGETREVVFATDVEPLLVDPDEFHAHFVEANNVEIMEFVHRYSAEITKLFKGKDLPFIAYEYIRAAVLCSLSKIYDYGVGGDESSVGLGDLSITSRTYPRLRIDRANAANWCELAAALRWELARAASGMKAVVAGSKYKDPMPKRHLRRGDDSRRRR